MKRIIALFAICSLLLSSSVVSIEQVNAKSEVKSYKNCKELNKDYPGGVAQSAKAKNKGGKTKYKPHVSKALYDKNKSKDRDKDQIACER